MRTLTIIAAPPPGDWTRELPMWAITALDKHPRLNRGWRSLYRGSRRAPHGPHLPDEIRVDFAYGCAIFVQKED